jgi:hypothetical protein
MLRYAILKEMEKILNSNGQKAYQRSDREDRSLDYKLWLRTFDTGGLFMDVDLVKWKKENGELVPRAITELTRCDSEECGPPYRAAIIERYFNRDIQGKVIEALAKRLNVPAYLVLFQKDMKWLWVYSFQTKVWKEFTPDEWAKFLNQL